MQINKRTIALTGGIIILMIALLLFYQKTAAPTRVALLNFPNFQATSIAKSSDDKFLSVKNYSEEEISQLKTSDFVLVFAMGLKITAEEREQLQKLADKGIPFYSVSVTNPANNITNIDSVHIKALSQYLGNRNKSNYKNMLRYIRSEIDHKRFFAPPAGEFLLIPKDVYYHLDENRHFETLEAYETYLKSINSHKPDAPKIAVLGSIGDLYAGNRQHIDSLITALETSGLNVYPILAHTKRLEMLKEINPDAVIYMPHGRLAMGGADAAVEWLKARNIPLFTPTTILTTEEEWLNNAMGMMGGFLSQSVVMPELDGAIYPYTLIAQYIDNEGFHLFKTIPDRLHTFVKIVNNFLELKKKENGDKKLAIVYFKGAGQSSLVASGMEVVPSLYNFLKKLKSEGYKLDGLPTDLNTFEKMVMQQGATFGDYAKGAIHDFFENGQHELVSADQLRSWMGQSLPPELLAQLEDSYGAAPGKKMTTIQNDEAHIAVARLQFGNVVLMPQPAAAGGGGDGYDDHFKMVHGSDNPPPYPYVTAYLWAQYGFKADALMHFGTHGSLEFTPKKQVCLSSYDWPDRLVGSLPHFYLYTISNVGEAIIAKRRSYATLVSHITPPFMESDLREQFRALNEQIKIFYNREGDAQTQASLDVKKLSVSLGIHRDLGLDSVSSAPYTLRDIERIENFADELANEKVIGQFYTLGEAYNAERIRSSVLAMSTDPLAYSLATLDRLRNKVTAEQLQNRNFFSRTYLEPAKKFVEQVLDGKKSPNDLSIAALSGLGKDELDNVREKLKPTPARRGGHPGRAAAETEEEAHTPAPEEKNLLQAVETIIHTVENIKKYSTYLLTSPSAELDALLNAFNGGYVAPSPGGDAVANPNTLPTGRNLYSINAEATPSESAWDKGVLLAQNTLETYIERNGALPRKVSYTFWSSEFIETEGATIAQALYMLGVAPVWDAFGRVGDLRLIPSAELGRPRIDVVVQTSGQFRDLAASRLALLNRAVEMAANASEDEFHNNVADGTVETERLLVENGATPRAAREMSLYRVFGGVNGSYGTGIMGMVESGDRWEDEAQIAETYLHNMSAIYGNDHEWGEFREGLLEAVLHNADLVVQPRQNNTWGPISLDHVYEFMGGLNLAIRHVTGKDPDAYFSDYRNRHNPRMQEVKEAIGVESRTSIFNPAYISEQMKGSASSAGNFAQIINNIYGWNVMKPEAIDNEMWDKIHSVYVNDEYQLNLHAFFETTSPAALQEITAIMMETARKGYWEATEQQLASLAELHSELINKYNPACSGFVCDNAKLRQFIAGNLNATKAPAYNQQMSKVRDENAQTDGTVMSREQMSQSADAEKSPLSGLAVIAMAIILLLGLVLWLRKHRK